MRPENGTRRILTLLLTLALVFSAATAAGTYALMKEVSNTLENYFGAPYELFAFYSEEANQDGVSTGSLYFYQAPELPVQNEDGSYQDYDGHPVTQLYTDFSDKEYSMKYGEEALREVYIAIIAIFSQLFASDEPVAMSLASDGLSIPDLGQMMLSTASEDEPAQQAVDVSSLEEKMMELVQVVADLPEWCPNMATIVATMANGDGTLEELLAAYLEASGYRVITSVKIPEPISTSNMDYWFCGLMFCQSVEGLENVNGARLTSLEGTFSMCGTVTYMMNEGYPDTFTPGALDLSGLDTSNVTNMANLFATHCGLLMNTFFNGEQAPYMVMLNCTGAFTTAKAQTVENMFLGVMAGVNGFSTFDTNNVTDMSSMFQAAVVADLQNEDTLDLSHFNTSKVQNMSGLFFMSGQTITGLNNWVTSSVTDMSDLLAASAIDLSELSGWDTGNVTKMSRTFALMQQPIDDLSWLDTGRVTDMSGMFMLYGGDTLDLSGFKMDAVTDISGMFSFSNNLKTIWVAEDFKIPEAAKESTDIFSYSYMIVGCKDTIFIDVYGDAETPVVDAQFAKIDGGRWTDPGYFSVKGQELGRTIFVVIYEEEPNTACFYFGNDMPSSGDTTFRSTGKTVKTSYPNMEIMRYLPGSHDFPTLWFRWTAKNQINNVQFVDHLQPMYMDHWFQWSTDLKDFVLHNVDTSRVVSTSNMFSYSSGIRVIDLSEMKTSNIENMSSMFSGANNLETIYVNRENWNVAKVANSNYMFSSCTILTGQNGYCAGSELNNNGSTGHIGYANIDTAEDPGLLTEMPPLTQGDIIAVRFADDPATLHFYTYDEGDVLKAGQPYEGRTVLECYTDADFPSGYKFWYSDREVITKVVVEEPMSPTYMNGWFKDFTNLTDVDLSKLDTSQVTTMADLFNECDSLIEVDLTGFDTSNVTDMTRMFYRNDKLTTVYVHPEKWTTANVTKYSEIFKDCNQIVGERGTVYASGYDTYFKWTRIDGGETNPGYLSNGVRNPYVLELQMSDGTTELRLYNRNEVPGLGDEFDGGIVQTLYKENYIYSNYTAENLPPWHNSAAKTAVARDAVVPVNLTGLFRGCTNLETVDLSKMNSLKVTNLSSLFEGCTGLVSVDLRGFEFPVATDISAAFSGCSSLNYIYCDKSWAANNPASENLFLGCVNLISGQATKYTEAHASDLSYAKNDLKFGGNGYFSLPEQFKQLNLYGGDRYSWTTQYTEDHVIGYYYMYEFKAGVVENGNYSLQDMEGIVQGQLPGYDDITQGCEETSDENKTSRGYRFDTFMEHFAPVLYEHFDSIVFHTDNIIIGGHDMRIRVPEGKQLKIQQMYYYLDTSKTTPLFTLEYANMTLELENVTLVTKVASQPVIKITSTNGSASKETQVILTNVTFQRPAYTGSVASIIAENEGVVGTTVTISGCTEEPATEQPIYYGGQYYDINGNLLTSAADEDEPEATDPVPTDPEPTDPVPTDPEPTDPVPTDPEPTDPEPTDPEPTDPEPTDPEPTDPEPTNPEPTDPEPTDPEPTDPEPTDPEPTDPEPTDPEPTDPEPTDPEPTDPEPTDPEPTDPEPTNPEPTDPEPEEGGDPV